MSAGAGAVLGPYEIRSQLGAGGMGHVYRAHDKRLRRDVALKLLSPDLLRNPLYRRRFADEAQAISALNHPNIVSIFDVSLESTPPYIVSELVEGQTLQDAMEGHHLPLRKVLDIATQIADGLTAAHQAGIIHRDLKPQNIMIRPDGRVKILDFGLAKQLPEAKGEPDEQATLAMSLTNEGAIVGTVFYMSPEQARGQTLDTRSDIFSFGVILYEMLAGKRPFEGVSKIDTVSSLLRDDPPPIEANIPVPLRWTIERCLAKERTQRYDSTRDLFNDLRQQRDHYGLMTSAIQSAIVPVAAPRASLRRWWPGLLLLGGLLAGFLLAALLSAPGAPALQASQFHPLASTGAADDPVAAAWSPDGSSIAYPAGVDGRSQVFTRSLESASPLQVTHCSVDCTNPVWSADGNRLFLQMNKSSLWSVGAAGGEPQKVIDNVDRFALSRDRNLLVFVRHEYPSFHIWLSSPPGATPVRYSPAPFEASDYTGIRFSISPDSKKLLLWVSMQSVARRSEFWLLPLPPGSGQPHRVLQSLADSLVVRGISWMPDSRRVVLAPVIPPDLYRSHLYIATVEKNRIEPLVTGTGREEFPAVARDGKRLAYTAMEWDYNLVEIPLDGSPVRDLLGTNRIEYSPSWSPRGRQFAYVTDRRGAEEIWVKAMEAGFDKPVVTPRSFPDGGAKILDSPAFSPDAERLAFSAGGRIWIAAVAGGAAIRLTDTEDAQEYSPTWSPDGNWIAFFSQGNKLRLEKARVGGRGPATSLIETKDGFTLCTPDWSPKGDWIAYYADGATVLVSADGKKTRILRKPALLAKGWSRDGSVLYGVADENGKQTLVAVDIATGRERKIIDLGSAAVHGPWAPDLRLSLSPDGKALATTVSRKSGDIWMLEDFDRPSGLLARLGLPKIFGAR